MARNDLQRFLVRLFALLCLLSCMVGLLIWQRKDDLVAIQNRLSGKLHQKRELLSTPQAAAVEELNEKLLVTARAKRPQIVALMNEAKRSAAMGDLAVPVALKATTAAQFRERQRAFRMRELADYRKLTADPAEAQPAAEQFLKAYLDQMIDRDERGPDYAQLNDLGQAALDAGSRDPMVRTYHGLARLTATGENEEPKKAWIEAVAELPRTKYPKIVEVYARYFLRELSKKNFQQQDLAPFRTLAPEPLVASIQEEGPGGEWRDCLCDRILRFWQTNSLDENEALLTACRDYQSIDEYLLHYLLGSHYVVLAWGHRGSGYADTVTSEKWEQFHAHARCAADHLEYAWTLQSDLPYAPESLIVLGKAGAGTSEGPHFWFVRTIEARFDYYPAYTQMLEALLPRWGGSHEAMARLARNCIGTDRFDTFVPYYFVDLSRFLNEREKTRFSDLPSAGKLLREFVTRRNAFRTRAPDNPLYGDNEDYQSEIILMMENCQLADLAATELRAAGTRLNWTKLQRDQRPGRLLAARRLAAHGPAGEQVIEFDETLRQPWDAESDAARLNSLTQTFEELKGKARNDEAAIAFFVHAGVVLDQLKKYSTGDWVDLKIGRELAGWEPYCDRWSVDDRGRVELSGRARESQQVNLRPLANFQPPLQLEATLEVLDPEPYPLVAGFGWCREGPLDRSAAAKFPRFGLSESGFKMSGQPFARRDSVKMYGVPRDFNMYRLYSTGEHRLKLKLWDDVAEFIVDDAFWIVPTLNRKWDRTGFLCLGSSLETKPDSGVMRLSQIRIRKLAEDSPPGESSPFEVQMNYWEARQASDPQDIVALGRLCRLRYEQRRYEEVLELSDRLLNEFPNITDVAIWKARALLAARGDEAGALKIVEGILRVSAHDDPEVLSTNAEILAMARDEKLRNGKNAMSLANLSLQVTERKHAGSLAASAAAIAEQGNIPAAVATLQQALELASEAEKRDWQPRLTKYQSGEVFRFPAPTGSSP